MHPGLRGSRARGSPRVPGAAGGGASSPAPASRPLPLPGGPEVARREARRPRAERGAGRDARPPAAPVPEPGRGEAPRQVAEAWAGVRAAVAACAAAARRAGAWCLLPLRPPGPLPAGRPRPRGGPRARQAGPSRPQPRGAPADGGQQPRPPALIVGVKKGGTRALLLFLRLHPDVARSVPSPTSSTGATSAASPGTGTSSMPVTLWRGPRGRSCCGSRAMSWWTGQMKATTAASTQPERSGCLRPASIHPGPATSVDTPTLRPPVPDHLPVHLLPHPSPEGLSSQLYVPFSIANQQEIGGNSFCSEVPGSLWGASKSG
nr:heparan sulfate glucosamine 3-O-sulfotransferase 6 [Manis javanica]XP_036859877.1 heparan sulfate glucosamine 3-O-sulfotransferase 6 [Manis javanica]